MALQFLKNILNRNDKSEHITHLDNVVRIIITWSEFFVPDTGNKKNIPMLKREDIFGRSVIIGFQKTQIYQRFAGSRQEVFILKIQNDENNAAQQDNGRRFHI